MKVGNDSFYTSGKLKVDLICHSPSKPMRILMFMVRTSIWPWVASDEPSVSHGQNASEITPLHFVSNKVKFRLTLYKIPHYEPRWFG